MTSEDRLAALEMRFAEQERTIEELSDQMAEQWRATERLQKKLEALTEQFEALQEQGGPEDADTRPPHW